MEAQLLEDAELAMHTTVKRGGSESEKVKIEHTVPVNVNFQINLESNSPFPLLSALPGAPPFHTDSHNSSKTWSPTVKDISRTQSINNKPKSEKADSIHLPAINLPDLSACAMKSEVGRTSPIMNAHAKSYVP